MNMKNMVFVGLLLVSVILFMGLKDETHPKWEYGQLRIINHEMGVWDQSYVDFKTLIKDFTFQYTPDSQNPPQVIKDFQKERLSMFLKGLDYPGYESDDVINYYVDNMNHQSGSGVVFLINVLGRIGWELVNNTVRQDHIGPHQNELVYIYYFKRRIQ
tara:strand:- start:131 stop:604 length:474 start_codon:yes stop_codon:yes gene_type:complete